MPENMYKNIALSGCQCEAGGVLWASPGRDPSSPVDRRCVGVRVLEVRNALKQNQLEKSTVNVFLQNGNNFLSLKVVCPWKDDSKRI